MSNSCADSQGRPSCCCLLVLIVAFFTVMPHRWSPAKLAIRRAIALERGFVCLCPAGQMFVSVISPLAPRVKRISQGFAATQRLELATGLHRRSAHELLLAAKDTITEDEALAFTTVNRAANAAKHAPFLRPRRPAPAEDLPGTVLTPSCDQELPCIGMDDCDLELPATEQVEKTEVLCLLAKI